MHKYAKKFMVGLLSFALAFPAGIAKAPEAVAAATDPITTVEKVYLVGDGTSKETLEFNLDDFVADGKLLTRAISDGSVVWEVTAGDTYLKAGTKVEPVSGTAVSVTGGSVAVGGIATVTATMEITGPSVYTETYNVYVGGTSADYSHDVTAPKKFMKGITDTLKMKGVSGTTLLKAISTDLKVISVDPDTNALTAVSESTHKRTVCACVQGGYLDISFFHSFLRFVIRNLLYPLPSALHL